MRCRLPSRRSRKVVQVEDNAKKKRSFFHLALLRHSQRHSRLVQTEANASPPYLYIYTKLPPTSLNLILGFAMMVSSSETLIAGFAMMVSNHEINFMVITGENARCPCPMRPMAVGLSLSSDAAEGCGRMKTMAADTKTMAADKKTANLFLSPRGLYYFCGSYCDAARLLPLQRVRFRAPWRDDRGAGKPFLMVKKGEYVQGNGCGRI